MDKKIKSLFRIIHAPKDPSPYQQGYIDGWTAVSKQNIPGNDYLWWQEYSEGYVDGRADRQQTYQANKDLFDTWDNSIGMSQEDYLLTSLRLTSLTLKRVY